MKKYALLFIFTSFLGSCAIEYYPNTVNAPLFKGGQQFEGSISNGTHGTDLQLAFAPVNHLGIIATGSYADREGNDEDDEGANTFHKHIYGEFGAGFFTSFGKLGVFEIYGGGGYGEMKGLYEGTDFFDYDTASYSKIFLQPTIGISNKVFEGAFAYRISGIGMNIQDEISSEFVVFSEPVIILKVGYKYIKFISEFGLSFPFESEEHVSFDYLPFICSFGVNVSFGGYE